MFIVVVVEPTSTQAPEVQQLAEALEEATPIVQTEGGCEQYATIPTARCS